MLPPPPGAADDGGRVRAEAKKVYFTCLVARLVKIEIFYQYSKLLRRSPIEGVWALWGRLFSRGHPQGLETRNSKVFLHSRGRFLASGCVTLLPRRRLLGSTPQPLFGSNCCARDARSGGGDVGMRPGVEWASVGELHLGLIPALDPFLS